MKRHYKTKIYKNLSRCFIAFAALLFCAVSIAAQNNSGKNGAVCGGGATQAAAAKILDQIKKKYPKARIVKMRAVVAVQYDV